MRRHIPITMLPQQATWDKTSSVTLALGCNRCTQREPCGGLHLEAGVFGCAEYCRCTDPTACDLVCPKNPETFVRRVDEIKGFEFENVPRAPVLPWPKLPDTIPVIERHNRRANYRGPAVALSLFDLYHARTGELTVSSSDEIRSRFLVDSETRLVATGVDRDWRVESWWPIAVDAARLEKWNQLGLALVTVPNFSLFSDVPRPDNLHAMKRIALSWASIVSAGIPAALHVNARTERDYLRWAEWIAAREEVNVLAFEFATGCGDATRIHFHVEQLQLLARSVGKPLMLVVRGGSHVLTRLRESFAQVVVLDTQPYHRARARRSAVVLPSGRLSWQRALTPKGVPVDELLAHNVAVRNEFLRNPPQVTRPAVSGKRKSGRTTHHGDRDPRQGALLPEVQLPAHRNVAA